MKKLQIICGVFDADKRDPLEMSYVISARELAAIREEAQRSYISDIVWIMVRRLLEQAEE